jgi:hypothetical protein
VGSMITFSTKTQHRFLGIHPFHFKATFQIPGGHNSQFISRVTSDVNFSSVNRLIEDLLLYMYITGKHSAL